jgi:hypothetical protein
VKNYTKLEGKSACHDRKFRAVWSVECARQNSFFDPILLTPRAVLSSSLVSFLMFYDFRVELGS